MTEKIREYKMNGSLIIGVDAGYGNFKTARRVEQHSAYFWIPYILYGCF